MWQKHNGDTLMPVYHVSTFTESKVLEEIGAGDELVTRIEGATSFSKGEENIDPPSKFIDKSRVKTMMEASIFWNEPIHLQEIFDDVHSIFPLGFTITQLSVRRNSSVVSYGLAQEVEKVFRFKTFGFKPGVFKKYNAEVVPAESLQRKFKKFKEKLKPKLHPAIYRKIKDAVLMNYNPYSMKELQKLFFDTKYFFLIEEHDGKFTMSDFGEV